MKKWECTSTTGNLAFVRSVSLTRSLGIGRNSESGSLGKLDGELAGKEADSCPIPALLQMKAKQITNQMGHPLLEK
jgi:hypothetical protein